MIFWLSLIIFRARNCLQNISGVNGLLTTDDRDHLIDFTSFFKSSFIPANTKKKYYANELLPTIRDLSPSFAQTLLNSSKFLWTIPTPFWNDKMGQLGIVAPSCSCLIIHSFHKFILRIPIKIYHFLKIGFNVCSSLDTDLHNCLISFVNDYSWTIIFNLNGGHHWSSGTLHKCLLT